MLRTIRARRYAAQTQIGLHRIRVELEGLGIKYTVLRDPERVSQQIAEAVRSANAAKRPVAVLLSRAVL